MRNYSFLLIAHYATFAYQDMLYDYLVVNKAKFVTKMNFPLPELPYLKHLEITYNQKGEEVKKEAIKSSYKPSVLAYFFQSIQLLFLVLTSSHVYDVIIAQDSLLAFLAIVLKISGKTKKVIFYSHGIDKTRFSNELLNKLYTFLDSISARNADFNWFLSKKMGEVRKSQGIDEKRLIWIPASIPIASVMRKEIVNTKKIVFLGTVDRKNGANLLSKIILLVRKQIPDIELDVMGNGSYFDELSDSIKKLKLEKYIHLLGQLTFTQFAPKLTNYAVGIAPYTYSDDNLTPLSDSLKMRIYLAAGLPVVITNGFHFSAEIKDHNLGFAVKDDAKSFATAITALLKDAKRNQATRQRALVYSEEYDVWKFYEKAFERVFLKE